MKSRYGKREESVENYLVRRVEELGGETRKLAWLGRRRATDRLIGFPVQAPTQKVGIHFVMECKKPGLADGFPRANDGHEMAQWREHERMRQWGFEVYVVDTKELVEEILQLQLLRLE